MAFHKLPPIEEFLAARVTKEFTARTTCAAKADDIFATYLARRGATPEALMRAHEDHFKQTARAFQHSNISRRPLQVLLSDSVQIQVYTFGNEITPSVRFLSSPYTRFR